MIILETSDKSTMVFAEERRRSPRVAVALQVEFRLADTAVPLRSQTTDISMGGCYVEMAFPLSQVPGSMRCCGWEIRRCWQEESWFPAIPTSETASSART